MQGKDEPASIEMAEAMRALERANPLRLAGRVTEVVGLVVRATVPGGHVGDLVTLDTGLAGEPHLQAEVVGFRGEEAVLMPLGPLTGIGPDAVANPSGRRLSVDVGEGLLGRVLDGLGRPIDGAGPVIGKVEEWPVERRRVEGKLFSCPVRCALRDGIDGVRREGRGCRG